MALCWRPPRVRWILAANDPSAMAIVADLEVEVGKRYTGIVDAEYAARDVFRRHCS